MPTSQPLRDEVGMNRSDVTREQARKIERGLTPALA
jgi:hypothetical protein